MATGHGPRLTASTTSTNEWLWTVDSRSNGSNDPPAPASTTAARFCSPVVLLLPPMAAHAGPLAPPLLRLPPRPLPHPRFPNLAPSSSVRSRAPRLPAARAASGGNGNGNGNGDGDGGPPAEGEKEKERKAPYLPALSEIRWGELLSPEPANAAAVVLSGALAWAGASLLLQLVFIFGAIFAAAVKYSFVAAVLLFVLIALL